MTYAEWLDEVRRAEQLMRDVAVTHRSDHAGPEGNPVYLGRAGGMEAAANILKSLLARAPAGVGNFENQADGTAKCAACGFCVRGQVRTMRYSEP